MCESRFVQDYDLDSLIESAFELIDLHGYYYNVAENIAKFEKKLASVIWIILMPTYILLHVLSL